MAHERRALFPQSQCERHLLDGLFAKTRIQTHRDRGTRAKLERTPLPTHGRYRQTASLTRFGPDAVRESEEARRRVQKSDR